jgi:hypothetical protein
MMILLEYMMLTLAGGEFIFQRAPKPLGAQCHLPTKEIRKTKGGLSPVPSVK